MAREHLNTSLHLLKILENSKRLNEEDIKKKMVNLPKRQGYESKIFFILDKKTIIFDLDETLIHCNDNVSLSNDVKLPIKFPTG